MLVFQAGGGWKFAQIPSILQSLGEDPPSRLSLLGFCPLLFVTLIAEVLCPKHTLNS